MVSLPSRPMISKRKLVLPFGPGGMQPRHPVFRARQSQEAIVVDLSRPEIAGHGAVGQGEIAEKPARQVDQMRALVDQLAAAGNFLVKAPLLLIADAAAMAVAAANEHQRPDRALVGQLLGAHDRGMEAVIEADLDDALVLLRPPRSSGATSAGWRPAGFSTSTWRPASTAASAIGASWSCGVAINTASASTAIASRQSAIARAPVCCASRARRSASGSQTATISCPVAAAARFAPIRPHPMMHEPHSAVSPCLAAILRHDAAQRIDIGLRDLLPLFGRKRPGIPGRRDQPSGQPVALGGWRDSRIAPRRA